jgi:hypothetical protein
MTEFHRLVLELGHGSLDPEALRQVAALARLLDVELHALFVEDETLLRASALPFTREISPLSMRWRPLETGQLEAELRAAADQARRLLAEVARGTGVRQHFEVRRGDLAVHVTQICVASDIVVVAPARREATHGAQILSETADRSVASVLFLPPKSGPARGPIVVVPRAGDDPSRAVAELIAAQGRERLVVLGVEEDASVRDIVAALGDTRERLIVMTRDAVGQGAELAAARGVPVLVLEPG